MRCSPSVCSLSAPGRAARPAIGRSSGAGPSPPPISRPGGGAQDDGRRSHRPRGSYGPVMPTHPMVRRPLVALAASVAVIGLLAGCSGSSDDAADVPADGPASTSEAPVTTEATTRGRPVGDPEDVTTGLESPWAMAFVGQTT